MTPAEQRLEHLARTCGPRVLAYLTRRTDPRADAADVYQQVLATTWRKIAVVPEPDDAALAWMVGVARGELANHRRARQRRLAATERLAGELRTIQAADASSDDTVGGALTRLEPADREIVTLTYWEGLNAEQVGQVVGLSSGAVRKRLQRARERIATDLRAGGAGLVTVGAETRSAT